jgi:Tol biopolymer transport system component
LLLVHQLDGTSGETATSETIFTVDIGTGSQTVLGTIPVEEMTCCPTSVQWSADRQRAFVSSTFLRAIADVRSGTVEVARRAPAGQFKEAVSSRGDRLARVDEVSGARPTIVVADLVGNELERLDVPDVRAIWSLAWSPDDATLAVVGCGPCEVDVRDVERLLLIPVDGSPARKLADTAADATAGPPLGEREILSRSQEVAWSPDGATLAVTEGTCVDESVVMSYRCTGILSTIDVASGRRSVVLERDDILRAPSWSPHGRRLAFGMAKGEGTSPEIGPDDVVSGDPCLPCRLGLYVIDRDGGNLTRLADGDDAADWSPDGTWLAFRRYDWDMPWGTDRAQVWVVPAEGGEARLIAEHAAAGW